MTADRPTEYFIGLVHELRKLPSETEWVEFKHNRAEPEEIGEYLSALANSAALLGKINAYAAWGVDNATHDILGTTFNPANALIHQDMFVTGAGPMVEIFDDRIEITNPGEPLIDTQRFVDTPPKSRNEALASLMRRFRICEERGSGIDKVVEQVEFFQLPAPYFEVPQGFTRAVMFAHKPLRAMDKAERVRACYLHACLKWVMRDYLTNTSLRERFGVQEKNKAIISRCIREAVEKGAIRPFDEGAARKLMKYVPFWS